MNKELITCIIADDEMLARDVIRNFLSDFNEIKIIAECENGLTTLNTINELDPDLVFLDIQMPEIDGLTLLKELKKPPLIIFTTAFNQYAIKAFEINAIDYLLKPFDKERFSMAVTKVLNHKNDNTSIENKISTLQNSLNEFIHGDKKFVSRLLIKGNDAYSILNTRDVTWFEAYSDYVKIHTKEKTYLKNISLNELESKLDPSQFIRIHRSTMVNINYIKELKPYFNGEYHINLTTGEQLKLSRSYKEKISQILDKSL